MKHLLGISTLLVALHFVLVRTEINRLSSESLPSTPTDILTPYSDYPRFERSTKNTTKDNFTHFYETQDPNVNEWAHIQTLQFIDATKDPGRSALGTVTFVDHPRTTFSVLEPFSPDSCNSFWPARATVEVTASRRRGGCVVAQNAGFFRLGTSACLGNLVSDGRFVRESDHVVNANFGIKASGKIFVGYLSNEEVRNKTDPFLQLLSGVIWLVKNGSNFVNESMRIESDHNEETGNLTEFVNVVSARTAVGHDRLGRVMMAVVDGQTRKRGVNLFELADIMIRQGAVNAINLDGGGSATLVRDGVLASHVSDHCPGAPVYRCMRQVSTVVCAHEASCVPWDCNKRGECVGGECQCVSPWTGQGCVELLCANGTCGEHGYCEAGETETECLCEDGWIGELCQHPCPAYFYGRNCNSMCWCPTHGACHPETGVCLCSPGYTGAKCDSLCLAGTYGDQCREECNCTDNQFCHPVTGCQDSDRCEGEECNITVIQNNSNSTSLPPARTDSNTNTIVTTTTLPLTTTATTSQFAQTAADITENSLTETTYTTEYAPAYSDGLEGLLGWNISSSCIRSMLLSYLPLALCSCLSNICICFGSWVYWGGYKRRMLKRRGKYTIARQMRMKDNLAGRRTKQKEGNILQKIIKPLPSSYQLVSTQLANESSDSNSS